MKYTKYDIAALIISGLFLFSCQQKTGTPVGNYSGIKIAKPIIYDVLVKNPDLDDEWRTECLANTNTDKMIADIIEATLKGELEAFDYYDNYQLSKSEIKQVIRESNLAEKTAKIQFIEDWFWDKEKLCLKKKVNKIILGYEIYDASGKIRGHKAAFAVKLK